MNTAEWILVAILSGTLFIFLVIGIVLLIKLIKISNQAKKIMETGQQIAEKADDVVANVKDMTSVGGLVKSFVKKYNDGNNSKTNLKKGGSNGKEEK